MTAATVRPTEEWNSADAWAALHHAETSPHDLASIAGAFPHYAEQIARHPRAYPALIEWAGVVAVGRRTTPGGRDSTSAGTTDVLAAGRRESGAHPLAFSGDADAWRAAVAAGAALTQGAERPVGVRVDRASERVRWTPGAPAESFAPVAAVADPAASPWWADVTPRAAPALPASIALASPSAMSSSHDEPASAADAAAGPATASPAVGGDQPTGAVNGKALLGFVFAFVLAPLGIVFAHLALREIGRTGEAGRGYARAGIAIGYTVVTLIAVAAGIALSVVLSG
ncbi:DUF4190 domain-containing protein [Microbacterium sp. zg.Y909]|uniref:DUF4190 domain-containing protein n=1 Tax=Microbacterium sp. zg.Y909 TaxID=2969413 RepID=UPI00214CF7A2|nr:DUF4190 domain-containing protein [Microbacterium sp. zg.Y909]MCR2827174.1 DUF4190 domain-containing protein [Microbacterium sp. zg.Y909]